MRKIYFNFRQKIQNSNHILLGVIDIISESLLFWRSLLPDGTLQHFTLSCLLPTSAQSFCFQAGPCSSTSALVGT